MMTPGRYTARLLCGINCHGQVITGDLIHHLVVGDDGAIVETGYEAPSVGMFAQHKFETPRVWDRNLLTHYRITEDRS